MKWICPEQLFIQLQKELKSVYVLFGNDVCILKDSQFNIIKKAEMLNFQEYINIELDLYYNWEKIFNLCRVPDLLKKRKILSLKFSSDYPITYFNKNISLLFSLLYEDILLILYIYRSNYIEKDNFCFQSISIIGTFVTCITPKNMQLVKWVMNQANYMQLSIEKLACQLLCYYYENNLILLKQILQILSLIYSDRNLSFARVKRIVTYSAYFNPNHWIEAVLIGNKKRANNILQQLEYVNVNIEILLRKIQYEIFILINVKFDLKSNISLFASLKSYNIHGQYHYILLQKAVQRLNMKQLYKSLSLLVQMELKYKTNYECISKSNFELLTLILCSS